MTAHPESRGYDRAQAVSPDGPRQPRVMVFDVNETLSDMGASEFSVGPGWS